MPKEDAPAATIQWCAQHYIMLWALEKSCLPTKVQCSQSKGIYRERTVTGAQPNSDTTILASAADHPRIRSSVDITSRKIRPFQRGTGVQHSTCEAPQDTFVGKSKVKDTSHPNDVLAATSREVRVTCNHLCDCFASKRTRVDQLAVAASYVCVYKD